MNLVRQLGDEIVDDSKPVSSVLRKAKILASQLDHPELKRWLSEELKGYTEGSYLPSYRRLYVPLMGNFSGPFGSAVKNFSIPVTLLPEPFKENANELPVVHSVGEIEALSSTASKEDLRTVWPTEAVILCRDEIRLSGGMELVELYQPISRANFAGILDAIRTRFLDFLLGLQEISDAVLDSDAALEELPRDRVANTFNLTVYGDQNVIAPQSTLRDVSIEVVQRQDTESLIRFLESIGVETQDLDSLRSAIQEDGAPTDRSLGQRVKEWTGQMLAKAVNGTWKVTLSTAPHLLKEALFRYYGWQ